MPPQLLQGRTLAQNHQKKLQRRIHQWSEEGHPPPRLDVVWVGEDPASKIYVEKKRQACQNIGMISKIHHFPQDISETKLREHLKELSADKQIHGVLLQLPLPSPLPGYAITAELCPYKDVDGLTPWNQGKLALNLPSLLPCTPLGCLMLLKSTLKELKGLHATVVGYSPLVGAPMAHMLVLQGCSVTIVDKNSTHPEKLCQHSDIVVVATGQEALVNRQWLKEGATVIDVGIHHKQGNIITGDVDHADVKDKVRAITPVPGGVGPMTIAMLLSNTLRAYQYLRHARPLPSLQEILQEEET